MQTRAAMLEEAFDRIGRRLLDEHPEDERGRMLRSASLKTAGKSFAFITKAELVVKLPAARVNELIALGAGQPCDPGHGRPMSEWVRLTPPDEPACAAYVVEALTFVAARTNRSGASSPR